MASPRITGRISSSCSLSSPSMPTAACRCSSGWPMAIPTTRPPTSRPGTRCARWLGAPTSSTSPIRSFAVATIWNTSIAPAVASSPCCRARGGKTASSASGSRPTPRHGSWSGIDPTRARAMGRAIAGTSTRPHCPRPRLGRWSGSIALCSSCARRRAGGATSPPLPRRSARYGHGYSRPAPGCAAPPRSTCKWPPSSSIIMLAGTSRSSARCARNTPSSRRARSTGTRHRLPQDYPSPLRHRLDARRSRRRL